MLDMLREIIAKAREQVQGEKAERERTEEQLTKLLEDTCNKLTQLETDFWSYSLFK